MFRYTSIFLLLTTSLIVVAQPLYKWVEADGSITFSPNKPPAGTHFEIINKAGDLKPASNLDELKTKGVNLTKPLPARAMPENSTKPATSAAQDNKILNQQPATRVNSATAPSALNMNQTPRSDKQSVSTNNSPQSMGEVQANRKQQQCKELQKRVVSLERRLKTRLTPEDMDNTVVHMARYQQSYDQHCVQ